MKKSLLKFLLVVCITTIIATLVITYGCTEKPKAGEVYYNRIPVSSNIDRVIDREYNNVCYIYYGNSISCVPIKNESEKQ